MYDAFIGTDENGKEVWVDYSWLKSGCISDVYFNWMYSLWTAQNPDIRQLIKDGSPYRRFTSCGFEGVVDQKDRLSHYKRFQLVDVSSCLYLIMKGKEYQI